jgi:hypothetical protein
MSVRRVAAGAVVAGLVFALAPSASAAECRYYVIGGRVVKVCVPIEP